MSFVSFLFIVIYLGIFRKGDTKLKKSARRIFVQPAKPALLALAVMASWNHPSAWAVENAVISAFKLGTVVVSATRPQVGEIGGDQVASFVTSNDMRQFNRDNVGDALNLLSGVTISNNSRNERTVYLRGFDSRQAPLFIDGIPVYVPYDGYVDFNRFTTADLAAIQVAKGFSSVVYGPNTLGGAINLISRKPTKQFEGDASVGLAAGNERQAQANLGTNQGTWYMQAGASYSESDYFPMSSDYRPTATEDGGHRNNSHRQDDKLSFKIGLTPNQTDEYAISYYKQEGEKGQSPSTDPATARYWKWPYWNKESLYFVSKTALGGSETLKLRFYSDSFDNEVDSYTNGSYTTLKTSGSGSVGTGRSIYNDKTLGGSIELESRRFDTHTLRLVVHDKKDQHRALDGNGLLNEEYEDTLHAYAAEDNIQISAKLLLSLGYSHQELTPDKVFNLASAYSVPNRKSADSGQIGLFYDYSETARFYGTIAQKTRLPTLKDRYSARLGTYLENPNLQPEESINYEIGYQGTPWHGAKAEAALFYSEISDKIQSVFIGSVGSSCTNVFKCQMQNVGKVHITGLELGLRSPITNWLELGGNYTYLDLKNVSDPAARLTDVPNQKLIFHALLRPAEKLDIVAFIESDDGRWASNTVKLGGFTTVNLKAAYRPLKELTTEAGVTNLTDKNYSLADGFPNPGRMWFANARYQF